MVNYMVIVPFDFRINLESLKNSYVTNNHSLVMKQSRLLKRMNNSFQRLAVLRATANPFTTKGLKKALMYPKIDDADEGKENENSIAILIQLGYTRLWNDMLMCTANVAAAIASSDTKHHFRDVDVYVSLLDAKQNETMSISPESISSDLKSLYSIRSVYVNRFENQGADIGQFLQQLKLIHESNRKYDLILKMHTKGDRVWRERGIESLCGTPEQVHSIVGHFQNDPTLDMINPLGTTFGPQTNVSNIYPYITRKYNVKEETTFDAAFDSSMKKKMQKVHHILFPTQKVIPETQMAIVAGSMFWIRASALNIPTLTTALPKFLPNMTKGYTENGAIEHILERLFASEIITKKRRVAEIPPCPRVLAMYFPQYYPFPENDRFHGVGFTEWTILKPLKIEGIRKPLPESKGGLGYYDLRKKHVRKKQAELARETGINGFIYYHYWFSGSQAPQGHKVMYQTLEAMLLDGEPNLPFALSWANEPWTKKWTGVTDTGNILLSQEYGDESEWREHFYYLLQFFKHPNYIKVDGGKPMFIIYRIGHLAKHLRPMLNLWREMAAESGLPGIHIVNTIGNFRSIDMNTASLEKEVSMDAAFHFWPQLFGSNYGPNVMQSERGSVSDVEDLKASVPIQYWGSFTGFDRRPRDSTAHAFIRSVKEFSQGLECSFLAMGDNVQREVERNFYFVTAWNEWNEQATLEPDNINGHGYLRELLSQLSNFPRILVASVEGVDADVLNRQEMLKACRPQGWENTL